MIQIIGVIITFVWQLLSIPIKIDSFTFTIWQFTLFITVIAVLLNLFFKKKTE